jgi:hypothetical protein
MGNPSFWCAKAHDDIRSISPNISADNIPNINTYIYILYYSIWWLPELGVLHPNNFNGISIFGYPHVWKSPLYIEKNNVPQDGAPR